MGLYLNLLTKTNCFKCFWNKKKCLSFYFSDSVICPWLFAIEYIEFKRFPSQSPKTLFKCMIYISGVDFTKGFKTWHKFSTEIRFMLIPIIVLFIAHEFITGSFDTTGKHRAMTEHSTKIYLWPSSVLNTFVKRTPGRYFLSLSPKIEKKQLLAYPHRVSRSRNRVTNQWKQTIPGASLLCME